jgi:hypothetical protein
VSIRALFFVRKSRINRENYRGPVNAARAAERAKARRDLEAKAMPLLNTTGWVNSNKAIVRLPIAHAMQLTVQAYQNPDAARSNLISRSEKAAAPEPQAPEKPSEFE